MSCLRYILPVRQTASGSLAIGFVLAVMSGAFLLVIILFALLSVLVDLCWSYPVVMEVLACFGIFVTIMPRWDDRKFYLTDLREEER